MDSRYQRAKELFLEVCDAGTAQRRAVLERACAGDAALLAEVQSLLEHHAEEPTEAPPPPPAPGAGRADRPPERVGHYRIIREIGRGGMGVVYLGAREGDNFRRLAAVKVLKRGMDTRDILERFERERQVLATLNHQNIARLYDAGETAGGLPYFAMEHVEGQAIDEYCDTHRLGITERLELFRQVCGAVQYVHQNLMVHRDLKPSNILVTAQGVPKLLDFGIAKLINPEIAIPGRDPTAPDMRIMTPEYASPEQLRGSPITVATDIYSLGVILYQLVTGHRPYHIKGRVRAEIERVICEVEPERPSTAASRVEEVEADETGTGTAGGGGGGTTSSITPEGVARLRESRPERLRRRLAGDIDNIVLMALRKEPQRRYQSAEQFSEDLRRHLDGLPVIARKDTAGYRFAKFTSRHRAGIAAAAIVALALAGWGATATYSLVAANRHAERTRRMLDHVMGLADVFIFDLHDKVRPLDGSLPALELMTESAQKCLEGVRPDVGDDPALLRQLASAYDRVGDMQGGHRGESGGRSDVALENYRTALAMREVLLEDQPDDPKLRHEMAGSWRNIGDMLRLRGELDGALAAFTSYHDIERRLASEDPGTYQRPLAIALDSLGATGLDMGRLQEGRRYAEESLAVRRRMHAEEPGIARMRDVAVGLVHVGDALTMLGEHEEALKRFLESVKLREQVSRAEPDRGSDRRYLAMSHAFAAGSLLELGRPDDAAGHVEAAVPIFEQRAKDNATSARGGEQDLAIAADLQGRLLAARGDHRRALERFVACRTLLTGLAARDPGSTFYRQFLSETEQHIGDSRRASGDLAGAGSAYREAVGVIEPAAGAPGADSDLRIQLASARSALGSALVESGETAAGRAELEQARSIQQAVLEASPEHARAKNGLELTMRRLSEG